MLFGCTSSDVEISKVKKSAEDLGGQVNAMKTRIDSLEASVGKLNERNVTAGEELASLHGNAERLEKRDAALDEQYEDLANTVSKLERSEQQLSKLVKEAMAKAAATGAGAEKRPSEVPVAERAVLSEKAAATDRGGWNSVRPNAEVCEAIDDYTKEIDRLMRRGPSRRTDAEMGRALNDFKTVVSKYREHKSAIQIWMAAEDLKWAAANASRSRTYLANSGAGGWVRLVHENRSKLREICAH